MNVSSGLSGICRLRLHPPALSNSGRVCLVHGIRDGVQSTGNLGDWHRAWCKAACNHMVVSAWPLVTVSVTHPFLVKGVPPVDRANSPHGATWTAAVRLLIPWGSSAVKSHLMQPREASNQPWPKVPLL